jgi:nuclear pore complex protein Nup98-Nup96
VTSSGGLFGTTTSQPASSGLFGSPSLAFGGAASTPFGAAAAPFGQQQQAPVGTTVKFNPPTGTDTMMKSGNQQNINTRHQCITCMKEYENKSLEELRFEDYAANRKGPGAGGLGGGGLFGAAQPATAGGLFGSQPQQQSGLFGQQNKPMFGATATTSAFGMPTSTPFG